MDHREQDTRIKQNKNKEKGKGELTLDELGGRTVEEESRRRARRMTAVD